MKRIIALISLLFWVNIASAQYLYPDLILKPNIGINSYSGNLGQYEKQNLNYGITIQHAGSKKWNFLGQLTIGEVQGGTFKEFYYPNPPVFNTYVKTPYISFDVSAQYNIWVGDHFYFFFRQGLGFMRFTPLDEEGQELINQNNTRASGETYNNITLMLPFGLGPFYRFSNGFGIGIEATLKNPTTDYIDNISELQGVNTEKGAFNISKIFNENGFDQIFSINLALEIPLSFDKRQSSLRGGY